MSSVPQSVLHDYFRSSASFRVRIALNLKEIPYQSIAHHLRRGEQRSGDYLRLNPQGLVPTLLHGHDVCRQSLAILEYLEELYPHPAILPSGAAQRERVRTLAQIVCCDIHPINNLRVLEYLRTHVHLDEEELRQWTHKWIGLGLGAFESLLEDEGTGVFCHGDVPTLADICLIPQVVSAINFQFDLSTFATVRRIYEAALALPAFERALPKNQPDAESPPAK
jgi:maleylacetoacetate isomerase